MLAKFICQEDSNLKLEISDFDPPGPGEDRRYPAMINDDQFVVLKMTDVGNNLQSEDLSDIHLCEGLLETEVLPHFLSGQISSEISTLIYIEKLNQHVVYRSILHHVHKKMHQCL